MKTSEKAKEYYELGGYSFWKDANNIDYNSIYQFASDFHKQQVEADKKRTEAIVDSLDDSLARLEDYTHGEIGDEISLMRI